MITILYFAKLKEELGIDTEVLNETFATASELKQNLCARGEKWQQAISHESIQIAINQELSTWDDPLPEQAEIALFPPITGG